MPCGNRGVHCICSQCTGTRVHDAAGEGVWFGDHHTHARHDQEMCARVNRRCDLTQGVLHVWLFEQGMSFLVLFMLGACASKSADTLKPQDAASWLYKACGVTFAQDPVVLPSTGRAGGSQGLVGSSDGHRGRCPPRKWNLRWLRCATIAACTAGGSQPPGTATSPIPMQRQRRPASLTLPFTFSISGTQSSDHVLERRIVTEDLFRFPAATRRDPAVDAWIRAQDPELGAMAQGWINAAAQVRRRCTRADA